MPPSELRRVRWSFYTIDGLFRAAWVVWLPTFFFYLKDRCGNESKANGIIIAMYLAMFALEVTLGALADVLPGALTFYGACVFNAASYLLYALLCFLDPARGGGFYGALACELLGAVGMTLFSGAFERWYQSTLELSGERATASTNFSRLRLLRYTTSLTFGVLGILSYKQYLSTATEGQALSARNWSTIVFIPHFPASAMVLVALAIAYQLRSRLTQKGMILAGGRLEAAPAFSLTTFRRARHAMQDGWRVLIQSPALRGTIYLACAHQLALTIVSYLWPLMIMQDLGDWSEPTKSGRLDFNNRWVRLVLFWTARESMRALGAIINLRIRRNSIRHPSDLVVASLCLASVAFAITGVAGVAAWLKLGLGVVIAFALGLSEPHIDALSQSHSPPDLRSVMGSLKSMFAAGFTAAALFPVDLVSVWRAGQGGRYSFEGAASMTGALTLSIALLSWSNFFASAAHVQNPMVALSLRWLSSFKFSGVVKLICALAAVGFVCSALDRAASFEIGFYRSVVSYEDQGVAFASGSGPPADWLTVGANLAQASRVLIQFVLPLASLIFLVVAIATGRTSSADPDRQHAVVATNTLLFLHRDVGGAFKGAMGLISEEALVLRHATATIVADDDGAEVRGYTRAGVVAAVRAAQAILEAEYDAVGRFNQHIHTFPFPNEDDSPSDLATVVEGALDAVAGRVDQAGGWKTRDAERGVCTITVRSESSNIRTHLQGSSFYAKKVVSEAIINAVRSVRRARRQEKQVESPFPADIEITIHTTNESAWVYVVDTGVGLRGADAIDLAVSRSRTIDTEGGFGFGLYIAFALERLGVCSYFLTDGPEGGAIARISFPCTSAEH